MEQDRQQYKVVTNEKAFFKNVKDAVDYLVRHVPDIGNPEVTLIKLHFSWENKVENCHFINTVQAEFPTVKQAVEYVNAHAPDGKKSVVLFIDTDVTWKSMNWPYL